MSTDLFGESELGASDTDFEWDVFVPDADDAETVGLERDDDDELDLHDDEEIELDEVQFAWDSVLADDDSAGGEEAQADAARVEAAFTRMEHTVLGAEPETTGLASEHDLEPELVLLSDSELASSTASEPYSDPGAHEAEPELELVDDRELEFVDWNLDPLSPTELDVMGEAELELVDDRELEFVDRPFEFMDVSTSHDAADETHDEVVDGAHHEFLDDALLESDVAEVAADAQLDTASAPEPPMAPPVFDPQPALASQPDEADAWNCAGSGSKGGRSRVRTATVVLVCAVLILAGAVGISRALHHSPTPTAPAPRAAVTTPPSSAAVAEAARIQTATDEVDSATTTALADLSALPGFPTPTNVAAVVNPYLASLELYESFLSGATIPVSARAGAAAAATQAHQESQFLAGINGLPSIDLGTFIRQFQADSAQLQGTLTSIEHDLPASPGS